MRIGIAVALSAWLALFMGEMAVAHAQHVPPANGQVSTSAGGGKTVAGGSTGGVGGRTAAGGASGGIGNPASAGTSANVGGRVNSDAKMAGGVRGGFRSRMAGPGGGFRGRGSGV